ncbi:molybdopterin-guanine dinucleotide biosynthesis protein [Aeromicrobium phragmitis]|uniref:Molybdopterin-guanine dinucleotide biosynthesis protein n=1 Tax=Aeromicrobium phragmitis TaxID=2478914 RepID=A0A3L8PJJ3_9ACTN|nr:NTP transferase domain-containing protein [Aeromicrobium phragmitis]RLV54939.1 molybdopterin-guanine dinucleotide biosynthesis protein [Aeromicrobium phragmitis]
MTTLDAVVLAGGRARRLGGRSKPLLEIGGRTLLDRIVDGARVAGCGRIVVVGPSELDRDGVTLVREDPPFGGPVAALAAALPLVSAADVLVLAVDLVHGDAVVRQLAEVPTTGDGTCLVDGSGARQWLAARYRTTSLRAALAALPEVRDAALHRALVPLNITELAVADELVHDIDTPEDLEEPWRPTTS